MESYWHLPALMLLLISLLGSVSCLQNVSRNESESVIFTVKLNLPAQNERTVTWKFGTSPIASAALGNPPTYNNSCTDRCRLYGNTNLQLDNLTPADTGEYTVNVFNIITAVQQTEQFHLTVYAHVSNVALSSNASSGLLCPGKDSVNLTCSALGTNVTFSWYLDGAPLPPDSRYHLMNSNSSLIISPVMTTDTGFFTCTGSTSLNSETSIPLTLSFGCSPYGNVQCNAVKSDQSVTLSCSWPGGYPAANVTMLFQNKVETAQDTVTMNVPQNSISSGAELTCLGAQEGQITASTMILRTPIGTTSNFVSVVTKGDNVTMSVALEWSRNVSPRIQALPATFSWSQHDRPLSINGGKISVISSDYKSELVISSVTASDNGIYECVAENFIGKSTFPFELRVTAGSNQLSPGAIAGIVIAVLFVVALIPLTVIFILRKKNNNKTPTSTNPVYENTDAQAPNTYDRVITDSKGNLAGNKSQESSYQELQFPHNNVYNNLRENSQIIIQIIPSTGESIHSPLFLVHNGVHKLGG
ncbi:carcinoembryonic antigen-related cell adhesion molecule 1-like [Xenopus laevis]|uniref:Carcinoembryonic antigen-related cell adhesion molecule 1-like n=1 Tax=Xenopus laevis TaxID=8355 RepID=A0A8J1L8R6_XENLA|nr:carcinoembryonic antigen-related cell adhesion molecule 1-like [Xenopus laevis]